jgi:hypothetical protein
MYKSLCVAVLLLPTFALTQGTKSGSAGTFTSPLIVAKGKLLNKTVTIPTTTIFTPTQAGLYRLSVYATLTTVATANDAHWSVNIFWTDNSFVPQSALSILYGQDAIGSQFSQLGNVGLLGQGIFMGGTTTIIEDEAGQPISYSVTQDGGPDNSAYSLYYTLERLE